MIFDLASVSLKILTKKQNMSQIYDENGKVIPVTLLMLTSEVENVSQLLGKEVEIKGTSKGKGFTGVMKRWGFSGLPATHGHFAKRRASGSIGAQGEGRVMPSKKMAGRSGGDKITISGLKIVAVDGNNLMVSGPVPGHRGGVVEVNVKVQSSNDK